MGAVALSICVNTCSTVHSNNSLCCLQGVVNRDIKLENLLLEGKILKVCDFGFSKVRGFVLVGADDNLAVC